MGNSGKIILDLCGGTGAWSKPYKDAGYDVRLVTLPEYDVRLYQPPDNIYSILAAPPCTEFAGSGARWWKSKGIKPLRDALAVVAACMRIILVTNPKFWCLENPVGRLGRYIGKPTMYFNPNDYGDPYTKKTCLWGNFRVPLKNWVEPSEGSKMHKIPPGPQRQTERSITPLGFAKAFFAANQ